MKKYIILLALLPTFIFAQHTISGTFSPASDYTYAFLYHATPNGSNYVDRVEIEANGNFKIPLDTSATAGIYKIVYALPPEDYNFDLIYNGKESIAFTFSEDKGLEFTDSNENKLWASYNKSMEMVNMTISNYYTKNSTGEKAFHDIFKTLEDTQIAFEEASKGTLASTFVKANKPYVPKGYEDITTYSGNLKHTFLTHVDFTDYLLQSSDFLTDRVLAYMFGMSASTSNETYKTDVDHVVKTIGESNTELKAILLEMIWSRFVSMENETLANYVADTYLLALAQQNNYEALAEQLIIYKNNTIGNRAANFELTISKNGQPTSTALYDLDMANQYLVIFWSSTCGHCLDELPKVKTMLAMRNDIKVIAFALEDDSENWKENITEFPDFIHVLGLGKWDNPTSNAYGVEATPSYFLLNKDKTIIAKPYDVEALKEVLK
ncbi:thioredoxin-like domain-containing protein [uncultured Psychroserpens sp.]|uniref:TlpA family protein disulfide reductase n=1 Tax=uncultured Psychroserpens sp. TaxID=255436 RepID=UPI002637935F|nr:thioredoxin-like domain-containing protein [uncultured Psychroserpens sp.]